MTAADEYQRVLAEHDLDPMPPRKAGLGRWLWRCICGDDLESPAEHRAHVAQALAADPGVRAAVEREAPHCPTCSCGCTCGWGGQHDSDNPRCDLYRQEPSDG